MNAATTDQNKRLRFDTSVRSPDDEVTTPLASAKKTLLSHCESLQPQIATLLSRLGKQHLLLLQKIWSKRRQAQKLEDDDQLIPRSARVKFALTSSKLVEQDAEYIRLRDDTAVLVTNFQKDLKRKIVSVAKLEARLTLTKLRLDLASALQVAVQAFIIVDPALSTILCDKIVNTLLERYSEFLLSHLEISLDEFRTLYRQHHTIVQLPTPFSDTLQSTTSDTPSAPSKVCQSIVKINRILCDVFVSPWTKFLSIQTRLDMDLALQSLTVSHFDTSATDETTMLVDSEPPADPIQLKALIQQQVSKHTTKLQKEIQRLRSQLPTTLNTPPTPCSNSKNQTRDRPRRGPNQKNKSGAGVNNNDSDADKGNKSQKTNRRRSLSNESKKRNSNTSRNRNTSSRQSNNNSR